MSTMRVRIDPDNPSALPEGRIDPSRVDATTEAEIAAQEREDKEEAVQDMARHARRVRRQFGLSQTELARRIDVSRETIRNRKQSKRRPTSAARALLLTAGARQGAGNHASNPVKPASSALRADSLHRVPGSASGVFKGSAKP